MKIYTKRGDDGTTGLYGGTRVAKTAPRIEAYGTVDELNSVIGVVRAAHPDERTDAMLARIQNDLFVLGADLATDAQSLAATKIRRITDGDVQNLEGWIDELDAQTAPLQVFILPGGCPSAAQLHVARTVCRRAERRTVTLAAIDQIGASPVTYLNRLSDLLFVMARYENARKGIAEEPWKA